MNPGAYWPIAEGRLEAGEKTWICGWSHMVGKKRRRELCGGLFEEVAGVERLGLVVLHVGTATVGDSV